MKLIEKIPNEARWTIGGQGLTQGFRQTAEEHECVIAKLNERWRVTVGKECNLCALQQREEGGADWHPVGYFRSLVALILICTTRCEPIEPSAQAALDTLPLRIRVGEDR